MPQKPIRRRRHVAVPWSGGLHRCGHRLLAVSTALDSRASARALDPAAQVVSTLPRRRSPRLTRSSATRSPGRRSTRKIDSQLIYASRSLAGLPIAAGIANIETDIPYAPDGHAVVDVKGRVTPDLLARLTAMGAEVLDTSPDRTSVRVHIGLGQVAALAASPDVDFIQPRQDSITSRMTGSQSGSIVNGDKWIRTRSIRRWLKPESLAALQSPGPEPQLPSLVSPTSGVGSRASEGDLSHRAFDARGTFHVDGTGIKIGVLSNGVANLAASQALGDLGPVTVLPGQTGSGDEGHGDARDRPRPRAGRPALFRHRKHEHHELCPEHPGSSNCRVRHHHR
jgi:hypothetical protein